MRSSLPLPARVVAGAVGSLSAGTGDVADAVYGPWEGLTPAGAAQEWRADPGTWWVSGGWAIDAFVGEARQHDDTDVSVLRGEPDLLREFRAGRPDLWAAFNGALKPLEACGDELPAGCNQLWMRPNALSAWRYDMPLETAEPGELVYRPDRSVREPLSESVFQCDGVRYLAPRWQLLYKSRAVRLKDDLDFQRCLPLLPVDRRGWLADALGRSDTRHPWIGWLDAG